MRIRRQARCFASWGGADDCRDGCSGHYEDSGWRETGASSVTVAEIEVDDRRWRYLWRYDPEGSRSDRMHSRQGAGSCHRERIGAECVEQSAERRRDRHADCAINAVIASEAAINLYKGGNSNEREPKKARYFQPTPDIRLRSLRGKAAGCGMIQAKNISI